MRKQALIMKTTNEPDPAPRVENPSFPPPLTPPPFEEKRDKLFLTKAESGSASVRNTVFLFYSDSFLIIDLYPEEGGA